MKCPPELYDPTRPLQNAFNAAYAEAYEDVMGKPFVPGTDSIFSILLTEREALQVEYREWRVSRGLEPTEQDEIRIFSWSIMSHKWGEMIHGDVMNEYDSHVAGGLMGE